MWTVLYWTRSSITQFGVSINIWGMAGDALNITCNFLSRNHRVHRDFLIALYVVLYFVIIVFCVCVCVCVCVKFILVHSMKAYRGSWGLAPLIQNLDTKCRRVVSFTPRSPYISEITSVPFEYKPGGPPALVLAILIREKYIPCRLCVFVCYFLCMNVMLTRSP